MNDILSVLQAVLLLSTWASLSWFLCSAARALDRFNQPVTITFQTGDSASSTSHSMTVVPSVDEELTEKPEINEAVKSKWPICGTCGKEICDDPISTMLTDTGAIHLYRCACGRDTGLPA